MLETLANAMDLILVIIGFGLVIFIHELGHFLTAKWAGVRVHAFALGFGHAVCSYRRGMGFRLGSSEPDYEKGLKHGDADAADVSPTEYRLNWIPFGGYVKMLGQEDVDPAATSDAPDSFTSKPPWKRVIIMSGGVVMNLLLAAVLFIIVFGVGLDAPRPAIGAVAPDSPASRAQPLGQTADLVDATGLAPGDRILRINGKRQRTFNDVVVAVGMARLDEPVDFTVRRPGFDQPLRFAAKPVRDEQTRMLTVGVAPPRSTSLVETSGTQQGEREWREIMAAAGAPDVQPGWTLVELDGEPVEQAWQVRELFQASGGRSLAAVFQDESGARHTASLAPGPRLQQLVATAPALEEPVLIQHLLGLTPPMLVRGVTGGGERAGLRSNDVLARVGSLHWPDMPRGMSQIRKRAGETVHLTVLRDGEYVDLEAPVGGDGRIGFQTGLATQRFAVMTRTPIPAPRESTEETGSESAEAAPAGPVFAATRLDLPPGSIIQRIADEPVEDYFDLRTALRAATREAHGAGAGAQIEVEARLPIGETFGAGPIETRAWSLTAEDVRTLHALGWESPIPMALFEPAMVTLQAGGAGEALAMGVSETKRMILLAYLTLVRLVQGSVEVEQLKGPVGIAHIGVQVVEQGWIKLLFFLGLLSANLAVINFLPIPIADGGHVVLLLIEVARGKPAPPAVQNIATLVGLVFIAAVFVIITYNDVMGVLGL